MSYMPFIVDFARVFGQFIIYLIHLMWSSWNKRTK